MHRVAILLSLLVALGGCGFAPEVTDRNANVLVIGDSILAWNRGDGTSVADVIEKRIGAPVLDASVPGATMRASGVRAAVGLSIPGQIRAGDFGTIVLNGGANDLRNTCGCSGCDAVLDRLSLQDYPALIARLANARVVIVGYYGPVRGGGGSFSSCSDELAELGRRLSRLASSNPRVTFVPTREAIDGNPAFYDSDRVHPTPAGSEVIGGLVARALVANDGASR
ncbi:lysophospholipase L1-like esterase [Silicimonas algicola]|uniref:Lysophospholipase L1-like esterase n=1 Tax=Silicimonas algicola TaxID=1826607 RepID=A0A316G0C2_9RHOB|nr:lysophospholipase L1-like esterase [Silicimonas algicola]